MFSHQTLIISKQGGNSIVNFFYFNAFHSAALVVFMSWQLYIVFMSRQLHIENLRYSRPQSIDGYNRALHFLLLIFPQTDNLVYTYINQLVILFSLFCCFSPCSNWSPSTISTSQQLWVRKQFSYKQNYSQSNLRSKSRSHWSMIWSNLIHYHNPQSHWSTI